MQTFVYLLPDIKYLENELQYLINVKKITELSNKNKNIYYFILYDYPDDLFTSNNIKEYKLYKYLKILQDNGCKIGINKLKNKQNLLFLKNEVFNNKGNYIMHFYNNALNYDSNVYATISFYEYNYLELFNNFIKHNIPENIQTQYKQLLRDLINQTFIYRYNNIKKELDSELDYYINNIINKDYNSAIVLLNKEYKNGELYNIFKIHFKNIDENKCKEYFNSTKFLLLNKFITFKYNKMLEFSNYLQKIFE